LADGKLGNGTKKSKVTNVPGTGVTPKTTLEAAATETSCALILIFTGHIGVPVSATQTIRLHHRSRGYQTYFRCASGNREPDLSQGTQHCDQCLIGQRHFGVNSIILIAP
jgi:hypothetical protein